MFEVFEAVLSVVRDFLVWLEPYDPIIRFLSYIVSPLLTIMAFRYNRRSRKEMLSLRDEATRQEKDAEAASKAAQAAQAQANEAAEILRARQADIDVLEADIERLTKGSGTVWKIRDNNPYPNFREWSRDPNGAQLITFGNLKGGVGKTTLAMNYAAYVSETLQKRVLLVDLDFQGSLTQSVLLAANIADTESRAQNLFDSHVPLTTFEASITQVAPLMSRCWLVPASYMFNERENQMLWEAVQRRGNDIDIRYRLAHSLLRPEIRQRFDVVIFDMPPRMSLGAVNALVASHWFVVPTILDKLSAEAVGRFLSQMWSVKTDLALDLRLAGLIGMLHRIVDLSHDEALAWDNIGGDLGDWLANGYGRLVPTVPRKTAIANAAGEKIAYLLDGQDGHNLRDQLFDPLFSELSQRIGLIPRLNVTETEAQAEESASS